MYFLKSNSFLISGTKSEAEMQIKPPAAKGTKNKLKLSIPLAIKYPKSPPKTAVKAEIKLLLKQERSNQLFKNYVEELKSKANIKIRGEA